MRTGFGFRFGLCLSLLLVAGAPFATAASYAEALRQPTDQQTIERLTFLDNSFKLQQADAALWTWGWGAFNGGSMVWSAVQASQTGNRKDRDTSIVQAVESLFGVADLAFRPLPVLGAGSVCPQPVTTQEDRLQCLAAKEALAQRSAERAQEPYRIVPHAEILGFNLLAGAVVWSLAGFNRAFMTAVPGELIGELQLWTMPRQPIDGLEAYQVQFSPMLRQTKDTRDTTVGLRLTWPL